jgi:two-component system OmpR family sensor kinase
MSVIASFARKYWLESLWVAFAGANLLAILVLPEFETVPFHFIWVSFTLLYGLRVWGIGTTFAALGAVCLSTAVTLGWVVTQGPQGPDELTEVPLMGAMFLAMVWHARRRQAALEAVSKAAERERAFVRDASHQLKTPLAIARGYAQLIRESGASPDLHADIEVLVLELNRLGRIAESLLLLASSEQLAALHKEWIDFEELIVAVAQRWSSAAPRSWRVDVRAEGVVFGDRKGLDSALDTIVDNAVKATSAGDSITIVGRGEGPTAVIEVADGGCGIDPESLAKIFDRFWSYWPEFTGSSGTGLGLAIAKAIVQAHDGQITVDTEVGLGTTFSVRLPGFARSPVLTGEIVSTAGDTAVLS